MTFDFDTPVNRRGTDSTKWHIPDNELPMWVADMDFRTAPAVEHAILDRAAHGVFGYTVFPDAWYDAHINWWKERHGFAIDRSWLRFCVGVLPAVTTAIRALTKEGERVAILSPNYNAFFGLIENNRRIAAEIPMIPGNLPDGSPAYSLDWDRIEQTLAENDVKLFLFCNPQNPTGKIWERETMAKLGALCRGNGVTVLSDEIHSDIAAPGKQVTPFAAVNDVNRDITATFLAPTKAFNLMGLHTAAVCIANPELRQKICDPLGDLANPNVFACPAAIAAYTEGGEWLDQMNTYVRANRTGRRIISETSCRR